MKIFPLLILLILVISCKSEPEPVVIIEEIQEELDIIQEDLQEELTAKQELQKVLNIEPSFKVVYKFEGVFSGQKKSGTQTIAVKGDYFMQSVETDALYIVDKQVYSCALEQGEQVCYRIPQTETPEKQNTTIPDDFAVSRIDDIKLVGETLQCFQLNDPNEQGRVVNCFTEDGILLYMLREASDFRDERKASSFSREVSESDFKLPVEPVELESNP